MAYLLDNNILSMFWDSGHQDKLADVAGRVPLAIVEEVRDEASRRRNLEGFKTWLTRSHIAVRSIEVGSAAHACFLRMPAKTHASKDLGERASIALASTDSSLVFVTHDKGALWLAHHELHERGERIVGLHVFLRRLRLDGGLSCTAIGEMVATSHLVPTWWADWYIAELSAR